VDALAAAGIGSVHVAVRDPNPLVNGEGIQFLQEHGIPVTMDECAAEASELLENHAKRVAGG
jgi:diaminohydroxyphosphoribosylaminopyrimidine deaminase/5-amino-6-(5-phosphoribosylamino)uracil reductase